MLEYIRKKSSSPLLLAVFAIIVLVFVFFGLNPGGKSTSGGVVAIVNGSEIDVATYKNAYKRELERIQAQGAVSSDLLESLDLRHRTLNLLINNILIVDDAHSKGQEAASGEVQESILGTRAFFKDGSFNKQQYFDVLKRNRLKAVDYEAGLRDDLTVQNAVDKLADGISLSDDELWEKYSNARGKVSFEYLKFDPADFASDKAVPDDTLRKFYDDNNNLFIVPTRVKVFYARASYATLAKYVKVSDEDIKKYYDVNSYDYLQKKEVKASHILIKADGSDEDKLSSAKKKAEGLLKKLKAGKSFSTLAKRYSQDKGSAVMGGDLGFFGSGTMVKAFEDAVFAMKSGDVGLVKTAFGYHVVKVMDIKEEGVKPLSEVRASIKKILVEAQTAFTARDKIESLSVTFEQGSSDLTDLEKTVKDNALEPFTTGLISEFDTGIEILENEALKNAAFGLNAGGVSAPVEIGSGVYLLKVLEREEEHVAEYKDAGADVLKAYRKEQSIEKARDTAHEILKALKDGASLGDVAKERKLDVYSTGPITREPGLIDTLSLFVGDRPGFMELTKENPNFGEIIEDKGLFYLFSFEKEEEADKKFLEDNKSAIKAQFLRDKEIETRNAWLDGLREKADIKVNEGLL